MLNFLFPKSKNPKLSGKVIRDFCIRLEMEYADRAMIVFEVLSDNSFSLVMLVVLKPRQGTGTEIMKRITAFCDTYNATCDLIPSDSFGTPHSILIEFYEKLGFQVDKYAGFRMIYRKNAEITLFSHFLSP